MSLFEYDASLDEVLVTPSNPTVAAGGAIARESEGGASSADEVLADASSSSISSTTEQNGPLLAGALGIFLILILWIAHARRKKAGVAIESRWVEDLSRATTVEEIEELVLRPLSKATTAGIGGSGRGIIAALGSCLERLSEGQKSNVFFLRLEAALRTAAASLPNKGKTGALEVLRAVLLDFSRLYGTEPAEKLRCLRLEAEADLGKLLRSIDTEPSSLSSTSSESAAPSPSSSAATAYQLREAIHKFKRAFGGDAAAGPNPNPLLSRAESTLRDLLTASEAENGLCEALHASISEWKALKASLKGSEEQTPETTEAVLTRAIVAVESRLKQYRQLKGDEFDGDASSALSRALPDDGSSIDDLRLQLAAFKRSLSALKERTHHMGALTSSSSSTSLLLVSRLATEARHFLEKELVSFEFQTEKANRSLPLVAVVSGSGGGGIGLLTDGGSGNNDSGAAIISSSSTALVSGEGRAFVSVRDALATIDRLVTSSAITVAPTLHQIALYREYNDWLRHEETLLQSKLQHKEREENEERRHHESLARQQALSDESAKRNAEMTATAIRASYRQSNALIAEQRAQSRLAELKAKEKQEAASFHSWSQQMVSLFLFSIGAFTALHAWSIVSALLRRSFPLSCPASSPGPHAATVAKMGGRTVRLSSPAGPSANAANVLASSLSAALSSLLPGGSYLSSLSSSLASYACWPVVRSVASLFSLLIALVVARVSLPPLISNALWCGLLALFLGPAFYSQAGLIVRRSPAILAVVAFAIFALPFLIEAALRQQGHSMTRRRGVDDATLLDELRREEQRVLDEASEKHLLGLGLLQPESGELEGGTGRGSVGSAVLKPAASFPLNQASTLRSLLLLHVAWPLCVLVCGYLVASWVGHNGSSNGKTKPPSPVPSTLQELLLTPLVEDLTAHCRFVRGLMAGSPLA